MPKVASQPKLNAPPAPATRWIIRVLLTAAMAVDAYLLWVSASGGAVAGCGPESNCHTVLNSRWAYWLGVPVSAPALVIYALLFLGTLGPPPGRRPAPQAPPPAWVLFGSLTVIGAGLWFVGLQLFVLRTVCPFCMTAHGCGMIAASLLAWSCLAGKSAPSDPATPRAAPAAAAPGRTWLAMAGAAIAVAVLALGQAWRQPKSFATAPVTAGVLTNAPGASARTFEILDGQFRFKLNEAPLMGKTAAEHILVSLFDYTCHYCRELHPALVDACRRFSNQLAIVSLPVPLDASCNPLIKRQMAPHTNACALARIGLTVWLADRKQGEAFDDWLFAPPTPPLPAAAEAYARQLVGSNAFDRARTNAWISEQLRQDIALFEAMYKKFGQGSMPKVLIGTNLISGALARAQLAKMLAQQFGLGTNLHATPK